MIQRRKAIKRSAPTRSRKPIKKVNAKRAKANHERTYGSKRVWIVLQPCAVCGYSAQLSDPAHVSGDGSTGRKASSQFLVPLCKPHTHIVSIRPGVWEAWEDEGCHRESHHGVETFERKHGVSLVAIAADYEREFQRLASLATETEA